MKQEETVEKAKKTPETEKECPCHEECTCKEDGATCTLGEVAEDPSETPAEEIKTTPYVPKEEDKIDEVIVIFKPQNQEKKVEANIKFYKMPNAGTVTYSVNIQSDYKDGDKIGFTADLFTGFMEKVLNITKPVSK